MDGEKSRCENVETGRIGGKEDEKAWRKKCVIEPMAELQKTMPDLADKSGPRGKNWSDWPRSRNNIHNFEENRIGRKEFGRSLNSNYLILNAIVMQRIIIISGWKLLFKLYELLEIESP